MQTRTADLGTADATSSAAVTTPVTVNTDLNRSNAMNLMHENLARAQMSARLGEAQERRRGYHVVRAARLSRKAERAAKQARLALARAL